MLGDVFMYSVKICENWSEFKRFYCYLQVIVYFFSFQKLSKTMPMVTHIITVQLSDVLGADFDGAEGRKAQVKFKSSSNGTCTHKGCVID